MVCNMSRWTPAASTNRTKMSFRKLSTPCFAGIPMRENAMYTCQVFRQRVLTRATRLCSRGSRIHMIYFVTMNYFLAPFSSSSLTTTSCSFSAAYDSGVRPLSFLVSNSAPFSSSSLTTASCPFPAAHNSGVQP